jgi:N-acetylglucosaminyl-diphospho-decaprenol L-rhamnosyltransferase
VTDAPTSVDAVVVAYNSRATLRACVAPLAELPWVTVTVVDNASPDDSAAAVADLPVRVIRAPRNGGFSYGCNLGIAAGESDLVLLLNPDARIDGENLRVLVDAVQADPAVGAAGPRTLDESGGLLWTQRRFPRLRSTYAQAVFLQRALPLAGWTDEVIRDPGAYARPAAPDWLSGACLLLRRETLEAIGGLDERFFLYSEDTDLFRRMRAAGRHARYEPAATARHQGGASAPRHTTEWVAARSRVRYARKHYGRAVAAAEACGVALGALTHAAVWIHRPARARGHAAAARAALRALRSSEATG